MAHNVFVEAREMNRIVYPKFGALILFALLLIPIAPTVSAQGTGIVYYFDAIAGYYYVVRGNYDVFYIDSSGNRIWIQSYTWDINTSYTIFQSPISARIYLVNSSVTKPILITRSWFAPSKPSNDSLALKITVEYSARWPTTTRTFQPTSRNDTDTVIYNGSTVVSSWSISLYYGVYNHSAVWSASGSTSSGVVVNASTTYTATVTAIYTDYFGSLTGAVTGVRARFLVFTNLESRDGVDAWIAIATNRHYWYYYVTYSYGGLQASVTTSSDAVQESFLSTGSSITVYVYYDVIVSLNASRTISWSQSFAPDANGRITALNGNILVDATGRLSTVNLGYSINYLSIALYASTLQVALSNDTVNGFIVTLNTSGFAQRVSSLNPVVYIRDLNKFYPLAIYGFNTSKTIIAVPAQLPRGSYTIDIIWNYPFMLNSCSNITATVYTSPSDMLSLLLVNGYVTANDLYQPYSVNIVGAASFSLLAGSLVEINMTYSSAYDIPIALPFLGSDIPIFIEMPLTNGSVYRATLVAYDGAVYAPHLYAWYFDGVNDYIRLPLSLTNITDFTALLWVSIVSHQDSYLGVAGATAFTDRNWWIILSSARSYSVEVAARFTGGNAYVNLSSVGAFNWVSVGLTKSGNVIRGYLNGALRGTRTGSGNYVLDTSVPMGIGARNGNGGSPSNVMVSQFLFYSQPLTDSEINNVYAHNVVNSSSLVAFLDPTFYNGTHYIDLSGLDNHGIPFNGVSRIPDNRTWIYTILNSPMSAPGHMVFRFFPQGTRITYGSYSIQISSTLRAVNSGNYTFYMPRLGDTLVGNLTIYSMAIYNTVYPVDPVNVSITVQSPLGVNTYPIYIISLAMGIGRGSWAYKIPLYITLSELPQTPTNVFRVRLPLGVWIKQNLLSPSLEDLCIVSSDNEILPFLVMYWESSDYAVVYVKYTKPITSTTLSMYIYLKNTYLWGTGNSFQSLSAFDLINPSGAFVFTDPVWNYTVTSTFGVYNYYVFTSWNKILIATTPFDGVILDPVNGKLIEYHGTYTRIHDITPIIAARELSILIRGSVFNVYADGNPALSVDLAGIFPSNVSTVIYYIGWSGTNVYVATTTLYTYTISGLIGGMQSPPPYMVNNNNVQVATPSFDWWSMMPLLFVLVVLAVVMKLMSSGTVTTGTRGGVRLP